MSFPAQVFRILIASPSDVTEERELAVRSIQEWNDLNAAERQIVLLPLRWETHSAPEYGKRPQEVINRQVVDHCDLLVGIFWTRVGSPTGMADSGTIEEIERVATGGKPVMLYFSQGKQDPEKIDIEQLARLREFKKKTFPNALIEQYATPVEFKDKLAKQIEIQLRTILATKSDSNALHNDDRPITDILLHFANTDSGIDAGSQEKIKSTFIEIPDYASIPDYLPRPTAADLLSGAHPSKSVAQALKYTENNKDYYRQHATFLTLESFFRPIRFWLKNKGSIGARDIYIDLAFSTKGAPITLINKNKLPKALPQTTKSNFLIGSDVPNSPDEITKDTSEWSTHIEVRALQPKRELSPAVELMIGAKKKLRSTGDRDHFCRHSATTYNTKSDHKYRGRTC